MSGKAPDIILCTAPNTMKEVVGRGEGLVAATEPLGLLYVASYLENNGNNVGFIDAFALNIPGEKLFEEIRAKKPPAVGFSCLTSGGKEVLELGKKLKAGCPETKVILGNIHADIFAEYYLKQGAADVVVHGEGEETCLEVVHAFRSGGSLKDTMGISFMEGGEVVRTPARPALSNIDELPPPARRLAPMNVYRAAFYFHPYACTRFTKTMFTSRGCPYRCAFCSVHHNRTMRFHGTERVKTEWDFLAKKYGAKFIFILDSLFMSSAGRIKQVSEAIRETGNIVDWGCEGRVNTATRENLKAMKDAGCYMVAYGIESGVQELLDRINKKATIEQVEEAVRRTREAGIRPFGLFMLGLPGETPEKTLQTIAFAKKLPLDMGQFAITTPYPGSELFDNLVSKNQIDPYCWERFSQYISLSGGKPVWVTEGLTADQLLALHKRALREFFFRPVMIWNLLKKLRLCNIKEYWRTFFSVTPGLT